jgi:hypothetical protein
VMFSVSDGRQFRGNILIKLFCVLMKNDKLYMYINGIGANHW